MIRPRLPLLVLASALVMGVAGAAGNTVYKWKDASGGLHFSDTPPPAGATLISGPKAPVSQGSPADCRPDISAEDCARAQAALQRDADGLAQDLSASESASDENHDARLVELRAQECEHLRLTRVELERRQSGESSEILTDEERAALPASIAEIDSKISAACKPTDATR